MKRLCLLLLLAPWSPAPAADPAAAALWNQATGMFALQENLYPKTMIVRTEPLDRRGKPTGVNEMRFVNTVRPDGEVQSDLVSAWENGRDVTADRKKRLSERRAGRGGGARFSFSDSPLSPSRQNEVSWSTSGERAVLFGRTCLRFDFTYRAEMSRPGDGQPVVQEGMAWIEEGSGRPVKLEYTLSPLPRRVKRLWTVCLFEVSAGSPCVLREIRVEGQGGLLFIRKGFRMVTHFDDYRPADGGGA